MIYYKKVKVIINSPRLVKVIFNIIARPYCLLNFIIFDKDLRFTLKF